MTLQVFAEIFDPVIKDRHNGYDPRAMKHPTDWMPPRWMSVFISSCKMSFPFNSIFYRHFLVVIYLPGPFRHVWWKVRPVLPCTHRPQYPWPQPSPCLQPLWATWSRRVTVQALAGLKGDLSGHYYSLNEMTEQEQQRLIDVSCFHKVLSVMGYFSAWLIMWLGLMLNSSFHADMA